MLLLAALVPLVAIVEARTADAASNSGFLDCAPGVAAPVNCPATSGVASNNGEFLGTDDAVSVFVGGDMTVEGAASGAEGRVVVMGDLVLDKTGGTDTYEVGESSTGSRTTPSPTSEFLLVGGDVSVAAGQSLVAGANRQGVVRHAGSATGTIQAGESVVQDPEAVSPYSTTTASVAALSNCLATTAVTGTRSGSQANVTFTGDNSSPIQIFDFDGSIGGSDNGIFSFESIPADATVIVNMTNPTWVNFNTTTGSSGSDSGSGVMREKLLVNVPNAPTVRLGGPTQFQGSLLIGNPASITTNTWAALEGRLYTAGDLIHGGAVSPAIHNFPFTGALPAACSSPSLPLPGTITVVTRTIPTVSQDFTFNATGIGPSSFTLNDDGTATANQRTFDDLVAGTYTVSEVATPGYTTTVSCDDTDSTIVELTAQITVAAGELVTCTFTNSALPPAVLDVAMATNGQSADTAGDAVQVAAGSTVVWSYDVTHSGDPASGDITEIVVTDNVAEAVDCADGLSPEELPSGCAAAARAITCPQNVLAAGESMRCTHTGLAQEGLYRGSATVTGRDVAGTPLESTNESHYVGFVYYNYDLAATIEFAAGAPATPVQASDQVTYRVELRNQGSLGSGSVEAMIFIPESMSYVSDSSDAVTRVTDLGDKRVSVDVATVNELATQESLEFELVLQIDDPTQAEYRVDVEIIGDSGDDVDSDPASRDARATHTAWAQADLDTNHNEAATNVDGPANFYDDHDAEAFTNAETVEGEAGAADEPGADEDELDNVVATGDQVLGRVKLAFTGVSSAELALLGFLLIGAGLMLTRVERRQGKDS